MKWERIYFFTNDKCHGTPRCASLKVGGQHWNHQFTFYINSQYIVYFVSVLTLLCFCLEYHSLVYKHILFLRVCSFTCSKHNSFIILAACARQLQKIKQGRNRGLGAVHKVRQHFLGRGRGQKLMKNWWWKGIKKCWHMGGVVKNSEKSVDVLYGRPPGW